MTTEFNINRLLNQVERRALNALADTTQQEFGKTLDAMAKAAGGDSVKKNPVVYVQPFGNPPQAIHADDLSEKQIHDLGQLKDSAEKLEAVLVKNMLESMEKASPKESMGGEMGDMAKDMFRDSYSQEISVKNSLGLATTLFKQLSKVYLGQEMTAGSLKAAVKGDTKS